MYERRKLAVRCVAILNSYLFLGFRNQNIVKTEQYLLSRHRCLPVYNQAVYHEPRQLGTWIFQIRCISVVDITAHIKNKDRCEELVAKL